MRCCAGLPGLLTESTVGAFFRSDEEETRDFCSANTQAKGGSALYDLAAGDVSPAF